MKYFSFALMLVAVLFSRLNAEEEYRFVGRHLIISYLDCNESAISDAETLGLKMKEAAQASGVTILSSSEHHFTPQGFTQSLLLSESHACIHTYPEVGHCFVDLFTCGTSFALDKFDYILTQYLKPAKASHTLLHRQHDCQVMAYQPFNEPEGEIDRKLAF